LADKALGPNSIISANSVYNLGQCFIVENQLSEAIPFLTEAVEIFERRSGKESEMSREASQLLNAVKSAIAQQERGELDKVQKLAKRLGSDPARAKELISRMSGAAGATAGKKAIAGLEQSAEAAKEAADKTGSRGHLDVDELVQFIQGGSGSKKGGSASKSKNPKKAAGKR
jgi:protein TIF31